MPWKFLLPAAALYVLVVVLPGLASVVYSFTDYDGLGGPINFVGLDNYRATFRDPQAAASLKNTLLLTVAIVVVQNVLGLLLALALHGYFRGRWLLRIVFFAPTVLSPVVIGYLWQYVYSPDGGLNRALETLGLGSLAQPWLGDPSTALWAIAATVVWQYVGYSMIIFAAGLDGVPPELLEAAELDGAGWGAKFRDVMLPLLAPAITINAALSLINSLKLFDQVMAMTGGGPGYATETLASVLYKQGFVFGKFSYSTALAVELTILVAVLAILQVIALRRRELRT